MGTVVNRRFNSGVAALGCVASIFATAACGSGHVAGAGPATSQSSGRPGSTGQGPAVSEASAELARWSAVQPALQVKQLPARPKAGTTLTIIGCPIPACKSTTDSAVEAAKLLGWDVRYLQSELTPESFLSLMTQVAQHPPNFLGYTAILPNSAVAKQLATLQAAGTKISTLAPLEDPKPEGPVQAVVAGSAQYGIGGQIMGSTVVADAKGPANSVFVWDPTYKLQAAPERDAFAKVVEAAGGKVDTLDVNLLESGKSVPTQIVSYVQSHPNVRYVVFLFEDYAVGVPEALAAAGLADKVKIVDNHPTTGTLQNLVDGTKFASIGSEIDALGYRWVDQFARLQQGVPLSPELANPPGWHQVFVKGNVKDPTKNPDPVGWRDAYLKAWRVS